MIRLQPRCDPSITPISFKDPLLSMTSLLLCDPLSSWISAENLDLEVQKNGCVSFFASQSSAIESQTSHQSLSSSPAFMGCHKQWMDSIQSAMQRWETQVTTKSASTDVDEISQTIDSVFEVVSGWGPSAVNLSGLSASLVNGEHLAAVLRATFAVKEQILGWTDASIVAAAALEADGQDPQDALYGLYNPE